MAMEFGKTCCALTLVGGRESCARFEVVQRDASASSCEVMKEVFNGLEFIVNKHRHGRQRAHTKTHGTGVGFGLGEFADVKNHKLPLAPFESRQLRSS